MAETPHDIRFALSEFDRSQLLEEQRQLEGDAYLKAVQDYLTSQFIGQGGAAQIVVTETEVIIRWKEDAAPTPLAEQGAAHLREGEMDKGIALLRVALERNPDDAGALFNLGMALGDRGETDDAITLLKRLVTIHPGHSEGWVALGVACGRAGRWADAIPALREAVSRNGQDGLARKNLGAALSQTGKLEEGLVHLKAAVVLMPDDAEAWLNLAMNREESGETGEASIAYGRVIALDQVGSLTERAEEARNRITNRGLHEEGKGLRTDVLSYCGEALRLLEAMPKDEVQKITMEIAMLGAKGLSVNDPSKNYQLRSLPGDFTGLHLLCLEYVGFKIIDPTVDIGFDIAAEYAEACRLQ
jgi:tetratricopeptide (TPR) repeat protein